jgi:hypothetical protein
MSGLINLRKNIDPKCLGFLASGIAGGQSSLFNRYFNALWGAGDGRPLAGAANFAGTEFAKFNGITDNTTFGFSITINTSGGFFSGGAGVGYANKYDSDVRQIVGGTIRAQNFILLHELAHYFRAKDYNPNDGDINTQRINNDLLWKNCAKTILGDVGPI